MILIHILSLSQDFEGANQENTWCPLLNIYMYYTIRLDKQSSIDMDTVNDSDTCNENSILWENSSNQLI